MLDGIYFFKNLLNSFVLIVTGHFYPLPSSLHLKIIAHKMKFFIEDFFCKCDQICWKLWIWSHLLKKPLTENFIFCAVHYIDNNISKRYSYGQ